MLGSLSKRRVPHLGSSNRGSNIEAGFALISYCPPSPSIAFPDFSVIRQCRNIVDTREGNASALINEKNRPL